jgi:hypothetical protein
MSENLAITPSAGEFDIARVKEWLDARPDTFEDSHGTGVYVVAGTPITADLLYRKTLLDSTRLPRAVFVHLEPSESRLDDEMGDADQMRSAMDFLRWLVATFDVKVRTQGYNRELTDEIRAHGVESQYRESVRIAPLPWANSLCEIGFFRSLDHGRDSNVSLEEVRRDSPGPDEGRVVEYLQSGRLYRTSGKVVRDMLDTSSDEPTVTGAAHLYTDGVYVWPSDLRYHVPRYHVRLPRHFLMHTRSNSWRVPPVDVAALPQLDFP